MNLVKDDDKAQDIFGTKHLKMKKQIKWVFFLQDGETRLCSLLKQMYN